MLAVTMIDNICNMSYLAIFNSPQPNLPISYILITSNTHPACCSLHLILRDSSSAHHSLALIPAVLPSPPCETSAECRQGKGLDNGRQLPVLRKVCIRSSEQKGRGKDRGRKANSALAADPERHDPKVGRVRLY